ncbi:MAG TPA: glycoside hydrolase family 101 beta sandwich domain-containing protein, partial [Planctomycetota bacterium]|nr:glycoside hydrolase family 101 beta sandwich domain-containing protein [Planctomycetota bacterium]
TLPWQHVVGNMGAFNLSPIATSAGGLQIVRDHYAALAAGRPSGKRVAGTATSHLAFGESLGKEYDIPGAEDPFRGDWADLLGNFYLTGIQELYHLGKGNVRTATFNKLGALHVNGLALVGSDGGALEIPLVEALSAYSLWKREDVKTSGQIMLEWPLVAKVRVARAGTYRLRCRATTDNGRGALNVYVDQRHVQTVVDATLAPAPFLSQGIELTAGEHEIAIDAGPLYARWSDGTVACWKTPYLGRGLRITNRDLVFADDYDRMWPDTWSGQEKIYLFSWDGTQRTWKLPAGWAEKKTVQVFPLTPDGRGTAEMVTVTKGTIAPTLKAQIPYVIVP